MKFTFVSSPYDGTCEAQRSAAVEHCRSLIKSGHVPISPHLYFKEILNYNIPEERELAVAAALEFVRRCSLIVVCDSAGFTDEMQAQLSRARRLHKNYATLGGVLRAHQLGCTPSL